MFWIFIYRLEVPKMTQISYLQSSDQVAFQKIYSFKNQLFQKSAFQEPQKKLLIGLQYGKRFIAK